MHDTTRTERGRPGRGAGILLVDVRPKDLSGLETALAGPGRDLVTARSGEEALRLLAGRRFAVALLAVAGPGPGGVEAVCRPRTRGGCRYTPVIVLADDGLAAEAAFRLGAADYLVRPWAPAALAAKVAGFVELFRAARR